MSEGGFSHAWLSLREPVDHRARDANLLRELAEAVTARDVIDIVDLGCGTGSNLRAMAESFSSAQRQRWRLCDYDDALLKAAHATLTGWADSTDPRGETLALLKNGRRIDVSFHKADLRGDFADLFENATVITASAFFDLVSEAWITRFAAAAKAARAHVYAPLIYNGIEAWQPPHPADGDILSAFCAHQRTDKGFGAAAGPTAATVLIEALRAQGYRVANGDSPWQLDTGDSNLIEALAMGAAEAVSSLSQLAPSTIEAWLEARRAATAVSIGHTDVLAMIE